MCEEDADRFCGLAANTILMRLRDAVEDEVLVRDDDGSPTANAGELKSNDKRDLMKNK